MGRRTVAIIVVVLLAACSGSGSDMPSSADPSTTVAASTTTTIAPTITTMTTTTTATTTTTVPSGVDPADVRWWNDRVFYEVFVRSFQDSDGDGIGDLAGLTARLDYLNDGDPTTTDDLGITGIWLMPIFPSTSYHGYDVTDYRVVNPDYGTMDDFTAFLDAAHERGIAVLIDLVVNHTSVEHPWFIASAAGDEEYADWYRWSATAPDVTSPWSGGPVWHPNGDRYYFGLFWEGMPDLDLTDPAVTTEIHDIADHWLNLGVDGFRLDAARHLIEDGETLSDTPATRAWLEDFTAHVHSVAPDALVLGEVWSTTEIVAEYVPDALDLAFEFTLAEAGGIALASERAAALDDAAATVQASYPPLQYATFLTNHDQDRLMSQAGGDVRIAKLAATWLLTSPGVPFLYYGEEIGLQGRKPDERIRTPMPWTADEPGVGFTTGTPWEPVDPGFADANVADQLDDPDSLLSHYRILVHDRSTSAALRRGATLSVDTGSPSVSAFLRTAGDDHVLVVMNLSAAPVEGVELDLATGPLAGMQGVVPVIGPPAYAPEVDAAGGFDAYVPLESIPAYGFLLLRFTPEPSPAPPTTPPPAPDPLATTDADAAFVAGVLEAFASGDDTVWDTAFASDAAFTDPTGMSIGMSTPLPVEAGFDATWDWDGDGVVTVRDVVRAQTAWGSAIVTELDVDCAPVRREVVCDLVQTDAFGDAAGLPAATSTQSFRLDNGLIAAMIQHGGAGATGTEPWLDQFARYEQWVATVHPDLYPVVFRGPCCHGTPDGLLFTPASVDAQRELVAEWELTHQE